MIARKSLALAALLGAVCGHQIGGQFLPKLVTREVPVMEHKRRRNQTEAYHRRIQKKWNKRYGTARTWELAEDLFEINLARCL